MKEFSLPTVGAQPSAIALNAAQRDYELKNLHYNILSSYFGKPNEDALQVYERILQCYHHDTIGPTNRGFATDALLFILHEGQCQEMANGFASRDTDHMGRGGAEVLLQVLPVLENQRDKGENCKLPGGRRRSIPRVMGEVQASSRSVPAS